MKEQGSRCANTVLQLKLHRYSLNRFDRREALLPNVWWTKTFLSWEVLKRSTGYLVQSNMNHWQHKATSDDGLVLIPVPRLPTDNNSQRHNSNLFKCTRHCSSNLLWSVTSCLWIIRFLFFPYFFLGFKMTVVFKMRTSVYQVLPRGGTVWQDPS